MDDQPTLEAIYEEVRKVNERLNLIESIIEEVIIRGLPKVRLSEEEIEEIRSSIKEMKKGDYVTLEAPKGA
jgi:prefoldin subunit 5